MKKEHRRGEIPDSIYLLIEKVVDDIFNEFDNIEGFDVRYFPKNQRHIHKIFNDLMREKFYNQMKNV